MMRILKHSLILLYLPFALLITPTSQATNESDIFTQRIKNDRWDIAAYISLIQNASNSSRFDIAVTYQKKALRYAKRNGDIVTLRTLGIEANAGLKKLDKAEAEYKRAMRVKGAKDDVELHIAMSHAYLKFKNIDQAKIAVTAALIANSQSSKALTLLSRLLTIEEAILKTRNNVAFEASVSRELVAGLLINELQIDQFINPSPMNNQGVSSDQGLRDYADSTFKREIHLIHTLGIRSFRIQNGAFRPEENFSRQDLALLAEDILDLTTGINKTLYIGVPSPYSDLSADHTAFNAFLNAITRGVIQGEINGKITPKANVSGAETLLALLRLKQLVKTNDLNTI